MSHSVYWANSHQSGREVLACDVLWNRIIYDVAESLSYNSLFSFGFYAFSFECCYSWILKVLVSPASTILRMSAISPFLSCVLLAYVLSHGSFSHPSTFLKRKLRMVTQLCYTESRPRITDRWTPGREVACKWPGLHFFSSSSSCIVSLFYFFFTMIFHMGNSVFSLKLMLTKWFHKFN